MRYSQALIPLVLSCLFLFSSAYAQKPVSETATTVTLAPSLNYTNKSSIHKKLFGKNYRQLWETTSTFPKTMLDTLAGGLIPYQAGGSRQTNSLHLRDAQNREYVLRLSLIHI